MSGKNYYKENKETILTKQKARIIVIVELVS
jgi:hypothetical protein